MKFNWEKLKQGNDLIEFDKALKRTGYVILTNTQPLSHLLRNAIQSQEKVFSLPLQDKLNLRSPDRTGRSGYIPFGTELSNEGEAPDPKEVWHIGREGIVENIWPHQVPEYKAQMLEIWKLMDKFSVEIMAVFGKIFSEQDYFLKMSHEHNSFLRMIRYQNSGHGSMLSKPHQDVGLFTLHLYSSHAGIEFKNSDKWHPCEFMDGEILMNTGDMMCRISNGDFSSPVHRVTGNADNRLFMGFFVHPNKESLLRCLARDGKGPQFEDISNLSLLHNRARGIKISDV